METPKLKERSQKATNTTCGSQFSPPYPRLLTCHPNTFLPPPSSLFPLLSSLLSPSLILLLVLLQSTPKTNYHDKSNRGMSEVKDPTIKLFGKTIQLLPEEDDDVSIILNSAEISSRHRLNSSTTTSSQDHNKDLVQNHLKPSGRKFTGTEDEKVELTSRDPRTPNVDKENSVEELIGPATSSGISEDPKTPSPDKETSSPETTDKEDPSDTRNSEEKTLKKPDKILPCPRCNSMDTKFCYHNNYNVNQPRHFCKNCQRYWTAGGTMRNVPVGSGRRKNKSSPVSHYRHIMVSEALQAARADAANEIHHPNGSILTFGSDSPLCESMTSALILADKSQSCVRDKFQNHKQRIPVSYGGRENMDDHSSGSSSTVSNPIEKGLNGGPESVLKNIQGSPHRVPCFPVPPWPCPWNSAQWRSPMPQPAFGPSGFPVSFYPTPPYWGCTVPNPWNMPWLSPQSSSPDHCVLSSGPNSQTLGKHSRDGSIMLRPSNPGKEDVIEEKDLEWGVLIPKTLRINDPNEAAKSSIWSTLGIKNENTDSVSGANILKAFRSKGIEKNHMNETSLVLQANPAALSRSLNFQETT